jgi:hypothetical protein
MAEIISQIQAGEPYALALLVSGFSVLATVYSLRLQYRVWKWPYVWGTLERGGLQKVNSASVVSEQDYRADVSYTYEVGGKSYTGSRLSSMPITASHNATAVLERQLQGIEREGDKVKVYHDPKKPQKSFLIKGSPTQLIVTFGCLFLAVAVSLKCLREL